MKFRTKLIAICTISVFLALLLGDSLLGYFMIRNVREEALLQTYQDCYKVERKLSEQITNNSYFDNDWTALDYFFKTCHPQSDGKAEIGDILIKNTYKDVPLEIYNDTTFIVSEITQKNYRDYQEMKYARMNWQDRELLILNYTVNTDYCVYQITDISYVKAEISKLIGWIVGITVLIIASTLLIVGFILKKVMQPLQELNETTQKIANEQYDERVQIHQMDEIGQLGTNFNKMAEAVEHRTRSLEESEKRKTLFMGNLTHELKTPMTAISGYSQMLLTAKLSEEDQEEALHYIYEECGRLSRLSKKMMILLDLDQETSIETEQVPVMELFQAAKQACSHGIEEKKIVIQTEDQGEVFAVDRDLMTDVLVNLLDNAIKASEENACILLKASEQGMEVQDYGMGIPKEEQEKIMEPFYMVDKSRSRKTGGAGLGLALTKLILELHHMELVVESEPGVGTRMILQFV